MNIQMNKGEEAVKANICMNEWIYWRGRTKINKEWIKGKKRFVDSIALYKLEICLETKHVQIEYDFLYMAIHTSEWEIYLTLAYQPNA